MFCKQIWQFSPCGTLSLERRYVQLKSSQRNESTAWVAWASEGFFSRTGPVVDFPRAAKKIFAGGPKVAKIQF